MADEISSDLHSSPKERPGGRSERIGLAVMDATIALLMEGGAEAVSFEKIASAAEVNRTTLYRRWGSKARLLTWVLLQYQHEHIPEPDTGSLEKDLVVLAHALATEMAGPIGPMFASLMTTDANKDEAVVEALLEFWQERDRRAGRILERAKERGELKAGLDEDLLLQLIFGTSHFRSLRDRKIPTRKSIEKLVQHVLSGFQS